MLCGSGQPMAAGLLGAEFRHRITFLPVSGESRPTIEVPRAVPSSWSPIRKLGGCRCARITPGHGSRHSSRRPPKIGRGRITRCNVSPGEKQRPRRLYRHAPAPGRQVRERADFECVECARLSDVSLVPARTPQPVDMLHRQPCARGRAHFPQHLDEHRAPDLRRQCSPW
jgi:hypothetical protein